MGLSKKILRLTPEKWKPRLRSFAREILKEKRQSELPPSSDMKSVQVQRAQVLSNRMSLLEKLPKAAICAEIGVDKGDFSQEILQICRPTKLWLIDYWPSNSDYERVRQRFAREIDQGRVEVLHCDSLAGAASFQDSYFDWLYLDTDHSYQTTKDELEAYSPKLSNDGLLAGHDYVLGNWEADLRYGVCEAVAEFCVAQDWELLYLTVEQSIHPSFAIGKRK